MGERRRVSSWFDILAAGGWTPVSLRLLPDHRANVVDVVTQVPGLVPAHLVPEALAWSARSATAALRQIRPDLVVFVSARAFHLRLLEGPWQAVLDYVDVLSQNYSDRASVSERWSRRALYRGVAAGAKRFESGAHPGVVAVAAGWNDAQRLGADWVPIVVDARTVSRATAAPADMVFVGTLSYLPNIIAVERLARLWPLLRARRPAASAVIAGARPSAAMQSTANRLGWQVIPDFNDLGQVLGLARVAIAPLVHATGIQIKVLDAAAHGLPQVVDAVAMAGLDPDFPAVVTRSDEEFVDELVKLLADPDEMTAAGSRGQEHIREHYAAKGWGEWLNLRLEPVSP